MDSDTIWRHVDDQRARLADLFDTVEAHRWDTPSLCEGWTVRDVAAHLTHSHMAKPRMALEAVRSGFRFNAMVYRVAVQDNRTPHQITEALRGMRGSRRRPPGTAECDPLMDVLVHGQDIAVPLGLELSMPPDAAVVAARRLWGMRFPLNPRRRLRGIELAATDADFRVGDGRRVEAPIRDIVMTLAGRPAGISALR
ncbi:maleylpyruvate isomerase family mycothiol-dependent enzyme [Mycobacterium deserti]|uniref:Maleylpyruvate isomerase family mycothiol-dependent enzyme n=1 Tax=Mycobacterium deserti TaxID=2978347 RepID=A0ABT2M3H9_9MYCO|nr:maleylpyruvate isomerase family mycothiol-dependent enzyme [Mycobacterium deserti]MCT7656819.1 maleylpyruvate isomerase family mycothiol-dependent enzyme [Mycobacterium deserti]